MPLPDPRSTVRQDIAFTSAGVTCRAWLTYPAAAATRPVPLVIMAHGFGGTRAMRLGAYGEHFNAAGMATLIFDYRHFGASDGTPRNCLVPEREIADWHAALACARKLPGIDTARIALWGTSFAGGLVLMVAAQDGRVAATVSQCPLLDGRAAAFTIARYAGISGLLRVSAHGLWDAARAAVGATPHYIPKVARTGEVGAMTSHDAYDGYLRLVDSDEPNRVTARSGLLVPLLRPIKYAERVLCPALLQICEHDTVAPVASTENAARLMPKAEVVRYPVGHFDVYFDAPFARSVADQTAFLQKHLRPES